ncbi:hypothetical protein D3C80_1349300 [compost metagenome]
MMRVDQVIAIVGGVDETTERQNQLTSCNAILDQLFAANGDAYVIQRGERAQVGAIECEESAREADTRTCGAGPELPFCIECSVVPGRYVMQGGAVIQRVQVTGQCMGFCVTGGAHRGDPLVHQVDALQPRMMAIRITQHQVDLACAVIDALVAHPDIQLDIRVAGGELRQPRHQPALCD